MYCSNRRYLALEITADNHEEVIEFGLGGLIDVTMNGFIVVKDKESLMIVAILSEPDFIDQYSSIPEEG